MSENTPGSVLPERQKERDRLAVAIDYETFYSDKVGTKDYSLNKMPTWKYCADPRFDAYLVAICGWDVLEDDILFGTDWEDGRTVTKFDHNGSMYRKLPDGRHLFVGRPENFPGWEKLKGRLLLAQNYQFDSTVTDTLARKGLIPAWLENAPGHCTADMSVYLGAPRNLKGAVKFLLGMEISKEVRAGMDGRHDWELNDEDRRALVEYGGSDAVECHDLWLKWGDKWPMVERFISDQKRNAIKRGVHVDVGYSNEALHVLTDIREKALCRIPWYPEMPAASIPALKRAVLAAGLTCPKSFAKKDPGFIRWAEKNKGVEFIAARQKFVSVNMHLKRVENIVATTDPEGNIHPPFKYFGAHTGRDTGSGKEDEASNTSAPSVNMLNMTRKPVLQGDPDVFDGKGVDLRGMLIPHPGNVFAVYDYSQIEARFVLWAAGDTTMFDSLEREGNLYQAAAVAMGWCKSKCDLKHTDPGLYQLSKAAVLGLSYSMGPAKFIESCKSMYGIDLPSTPVEQWPEGLEDDPRFMFMVRNQLGVGGDIRSERNRGRVGQLVNSDKVVRDWRKANSKVCDLWQTLVGQFRERAMQGAKTVAYRLPSGRVKRYYDPAFAKELQTVTTPEGKTEQRERTVLKGRTTMDSAPMILSGGKLTENLTQAACRDIMAYSAVEIERVHPTWKYVFSVYDEIVVELPKEDAEEAKAEIPRIMTKGDLIRDWTEGLPLEVEGDICDRYHK